MSIPADILRDYDLKNIFSPVNLRSSDIEGTWCDVQGFDAVTVLFCTNRGGSNEDPVIEFSQAAEIENRATGSTGVPAGYHGVDTKEILIDRFYVKLGSRRFAQSETFANTQWEERVLDVPVSALTIEGGGSPEMMFMTTIFLLQMDVNNGYHYLNMNVQDTGRTTTLGYGIYFGRKIRQTRPGDSVLI